MLVVGVRRFKCISKFFKSNSTIIIIIVSLEEEIDFIVGREDTNCSKTITKFRSTDLTILVNIENVECIMKIEIWLQSEVHF